MVAPPMFFGGEESPSSAGQRTPLTAGPAAKGVCPRRGLTPLRDGGSEPQRRGGCRFAMAEVKRGNLYVEQGQTFRHPQGIR